ELIPDAGEPLQSEQGKEQRTAGAGQQPPGAGLGAQHTQQLAPTGNIRGPPDPQKC
nr:hypothetical protein [Tanacetum cinerariifolium]